MSRPVTRFAFLLGVFLALSQAQAAGAFRASPSRDPVDRLPRITRTITEKFARWMLQLLGRVPAEKGGGDCSMGIDPNGKPCTPPPPPPSPPPCTTCEG